MDGVVGMEGNGPGSGDPVQVGALLASPHPLALDTVATALVGLPGPAKRLLHDALTARPVITPQCQRCGDCVRHCPPLAMSLEQHGVRIDYQKCIRCFCCQELCPHDAVLTRQGALLRIAAFLGGER
jgi:ferredoxin